MAKRLYDVLKGCHDEEVVKANFLSFFGQKVKTLGRIDHYTEMVLHEFKYDKNFQSRRNVASVIAQTMYYAHHIKFSSRKEYIGSSLPPFICVIDKNEGFFIKTKDFKKFYGSTAKKYDWDRAASTPSEELISAIEKDSLLNDIKVYSFADPVEEDLFISSYKNISVSQLTFNFFDKKAITEDNFWEIFCYWNKLFGNYVKNGHQPAEYFLADIEKDKSFRIPNTSDFMFNLNNDYRKKTIPVKKYDHFWENYDKLDSMDMPVIKQKADRLIEINDRRFNGDFYTPIEFAEKGLEYLESVIGKEWWKAGNYRFWDMAAGTGNLEFKLPSSALPYCYISSLREDDIKYCQRLYPTAAGVFQYDYLNDDIHTLANESLPFQIKMPTSLQNDLKNPDLKWIIFINPPFGTAQTEGKEEGKTSKDNVSMTVLQKMMTKDNYGEVSRELFSQFLYRISREFAGKCAHLCLFSKIKYITANNDQKMRDGFFQYLFKKGFIFHSKCFHGTKGNFPVGFLIWDMRDAVSKHMEQQQIELDVFNNDCEKIGKKKVISIERSRLLNSWVPRPSRSVKRGDGRRMPRFSSAFVLKTTNKDERGTVANGFICSLSSNGDDFQHQNGVFLLSAPYSSAGAFSVVPENFEKAMTLFSVKRIPKASWTNDKNMFYAPTSEPSEEFTNDCVVWAAFARDNSCVALKDVEYEGKLWQIPNNMFPFTLNELRTWNCSHSDIRLQINTTNEDMFLAKWFNGRELSDEANSVMNAARELYKFFYEELCNTDWMEARIQNWNVGLYQIKKALEGSIRGGELLDELKNEMNKLADKLLSQIYEYGFILPDIESFNDV